MSRAERPPLGARLRRAFWPVSVDREVDEELSAHIELQTRRFIDAGLDSESARRAARERFGDMTRVRSECRDIRSSMEEEMRRAEWLDELRLDVRFTLRGLRRTPLFAAVVIATMAIAIGACTTIFSVVHAVLLRSLPYAHEDRVDVVWNASATAPREHYAVSAPEYFDLAAELRDHDAVAAIAPQPSALVADGGEPERVMAYVATPNLFDLLGARPALGRSFGGDDGRPGAPRVIVLSHALWTRRFGADPGILGKMVDVAGFRRTVIGVMPAGIRFPDAPLGFLRQPAELWIPSTWETARNDSRGNQVLAVVARRRNGVDDRQAQADLDAVAVRWRADYSDRYASESAKSWRLAAVSLREELLGSARAPLAIVSGAVCLLLLIACINVANLLVARGTARRHEIGVRSALGAGRARLVRQLVTESVVLSFAGGTVGVAAASLAVRALVRANGAILPRLADARLDPVVLALSIAITVICGLSVGVVPAWRQSRTDLRDTLAARSVAGGSAGAGYVRSFLVGAQVAMALVVLVGAGLLVRSFAALTRVPPGFIPDQVMSAQLTVPRARYDSATKIIAFYDQLVARVKVLPGVAAASAGYPLPMSGDGWSGSFTVDGEPDGPNASQPHAEYGVALPGYFDALRIRLIAGREFTPADTPDAPRVVIVDELLAKQHWPGQSALGKRVNRDRAGNWATVVGVVAHVRKAGPRSEGEPQLYLPFAQNPQTTLSVVVRSSASPNGIGQALRGAVGEIDAQLPVSEIRALSAIVDGATAGDRLNAVMLGAFGVVAALLAGIGLYGVMAYGVTRRSREIGIRLALGGHPSAIRRMILREGLRIVAAGVTIGVVAALSLSRMIAVLLFGVAPTDLATYGAITLALLVVGLVATWIPARRATRIDPMVALREE